MRRIAVLLFLFTTACATPPVDGPLAAPEWTTVPAGVVESLCRRLREDQIASEVVLVTTTQPIATGQALAALAGASNKRTSGARAAAALAAAQQTLPIETAGGSCAFIAAPRVDPQRHLDAMVVELSSPMANPYARNEAGLFARVTLGGAHATWYWIPLGHTHGQWLVGRALALAM